jgi:hypothetical protein
VLSTRITVPVGSLASRVLSGNRRVGLLKKTHSPRRPSRIAAMISSRFSAYSDALISRTSAAVNERLPSAGVEKSPPLCDGSRSLRESLRR